MWQSSGHSLAKATLLVTLASARIAVAAPLDCSSGQSDNTIYNTTVGSYDIICHVDYTGGDIAAQSGLATFENCIELCDVTAGCIDVSYGPAGGDCWMKDRVGTPVGNGGIWTARSRISRIDEEVTCVDSRSNGTLYDAAGGGSYQVLCGIDYAGVDLTATSEPNFSACMDKCDSTQDCVDVSFVAPYCYMKSSITTPLRRAHVWTGKRVPKLASSSTPAEPSTSTSSISIASSVSGSATEAGSTSTAFTDSEYATASGSTTVTTSDSASSSTETSSGIVTITGTTSSSFSTPTPPALSCIDGQSDKTNFTTPAGAVYEIICNQEYYGGDLSVVGAPTFEDCIDECDFALECVDVSWVGGMCYMKKEINALVIADGVSTARKLGNATLEAKAPLTCEGGSANGTLFRTDRGEFYEIYCGFDFPGGDFKALTTDSFEDCLNACDQNLECRDLAYVAPSCYLKNVLAPPTPAARVWGAKSVPDPACAPIGTTLLPVANTGVDRSSLDNLVPSIEATLNYAEERPGNKAVALFLSMLYPQITLENSAFVSASCSEGSILVEASTEAVREHIMTTWPASGLVLFTNSPGCNNETSRGIYRTTGAFATIDSQVITFLVTVENFATVAEEVAIKYGVVKYDSPEAAPTATQYTSTCSGTGTVSTAPPTSAPTAGPGASLTQGALEFYNLLRDAVQYDEEGNMVLHPANTQDVELTAKPYDPDNIAEQEALEDRFREWGMEPPSSLVAEASNGTAGAMCSPEVWSNSLMKRSLLRPRRSSRNRGASLLSAALSSGRSWLAKRFGWDDLKDLACGALAGEIVGEISESAGSALEAGCEANEAYENRNALKCLFTGCFTSGSNIVYYTPPPATKYNFDYSWRITYPRLQRPVQAESGKTISCENCGFSISNIQFSGQIVINMTAGVIKEATITAGISGAATMIAGLQTDGPWNGEWRYTYSNTELGAITLDNAFNIVPTVLYGIGINYATDEAVSTFGGAQFNLNDAAVTMDLVRGNVLAQRNWAPQITFTNPAFTTGANIRMTPYMRWAVNLAVNIFGQVTLSPTITSETVVSLDSAYSLSPQNSPQGNCPANNLLVTSYVSTKNRVNTGLGVTKDLHVEQKYNAPKCYNVPSNQATPADMEALSVSGQEFCTSYINYRAPTLNQWSTSFKVVPSTSTVVSTTTITSTPSITVYATTTQTSWRDYTTTLSTVWVTATNDAVFPTETYVYKKRQEHGVERLEMLPTKAERLSFAALKTTAVAPVPVPAVRFGRRGPAPDVVAGWPASKISYACSQIATGKATSTLTATSTTTSGVTTVTEVRTANAQGPLRTVTMMQTFTEFGGYSTATVEGPTTATRYTCPLQTQVASSMSSCIKIKVHGPPHVDGKLLSYQPETYQPNANPNNPISVWYYDACASRVYAFTIAGMFPLMGEPGVSYLVETLPLDIYGSYDDNKAAVCIKDAATKLLDCRLAGFPMRVPPPETAISQPGWDDLAMSLLWEGYDGHVVLEGSVPISLTYEEVECPCYMGGVVP
ncbi:Plasma kallikrein [Madurella mycetomatis]|uniref:Plasma kallikrein n=1 Tax=Madurella mycetomatis TaxID=100816 RepID=A0A175WB07_9PEZI|nr:Plasma kallikrein [Madurella mycetomatis]